MDKDKLKRILLTMPDKLSKEEKESSFKVVAVAASIFIFLFMFLPPFFIESNFNWHIFVQLVFAIFIIFSYLGMAFRRKSIQILRIIVLFILSGILILVTVSNFSLMVKALGWFGFIGLIIRSINDLFRSTADLRGGKKEENLFREEIPQRESNFFSKINKDLGLRGFVWALIIFVGGLIILGLFIYFNQQ